jgi:hypothetical protein
MPKTQPRYQTNGVLAIATLILAIVGISQARAARHAAKAAGRQAETLGETLIETRKAADAAKLSAEVAKAALHIDRPYLVVEECRFQGLPDRGPIKPFDPSVSVSRVLEVMAGQISVRNVGKGPAIIHEVVARLGRLESLPELRDFHACEVMAGLRDVIRPDDSLAYLTPIFQGFILKNQEECDQIMSGKTTITMYGCIRYWDVFSKQAEAPFETGFL